MNKFALLASALLILLAVNCSNYSQAIASTHRKKHKTSPAVAVKTEQTNHKRHSKHSLSSKHNAKHTSKHVAARPRYAYPMGFFLMAPPTFDSSSLPESVSSQIKKAFYGGYASDYPTRSLVRTGIVSYYPMRGGIFWRREPIKYLVMHSTEPGIPVGAKTIIDGWSHGGRRHAGAHYVIDREGTIYQAVDPDLGTVHVNIFKTLPGINNDNCVGVEMCHNGSQDYPPALMESAARLAAYLQNHYHISDANIITHRYAQQGDHTDPVNFNWDNFIAQKNTLQNQSLNQRLALLKTESLDWQSILEQPKIIVVDKKPTALDKKPAPTDNKSVLVDKKQAASDYKVIVDKKPAASITKTTPVKPVTSNLVEPSSKTESKIDYQVISPQALSPFEAKFGPISPQEVEATYPLETENSESAPLPSSGPQRLVPPTATHRLIPMQVIINTLPATHTSQRTSNGTASAGNERHNSRLVPATSNNKPRILPLRGPIDMDPDEAAQLLNQ